MSEDEFENENMKSVIDRVLKLLVYRVEKENVTVVQNWPEGGFVVPMRSNELQHVFLNLIVNALDAMVGSKVKRLEISATVDRSRATVKIADTGEGIPSDMLKTIFDPFFTTKPPGKGTGLGLAICYSLVRNHGGDIFCASEAGSGSTFSVSIPLRGKTDQKRFDTPAKVQ
jgi:signal transduction histidine kinase